MLPWLLNSGVRAAVNARRRYGRDSPCRNGPVSQCFHNSYKQSPVVCPCSSEFCSSSQPTREPLATLFLKALLPMSFQPCIHMCLRTPASFGSRRQRSRSARPSRHQSVRAMADRCPTPEAEWSVSPTPSRSRSKSRSRARSVEPVWMGEDSKAARKRGSLS